MNSEDSGRAGDFGRYFCETWHEGVTIVAAYVVVASWQAFGLPVGGRLFAATVVYFAAKLQ